MLIFLFRSIYPKILYEKDAFNMGAKAAKLGGGGGGGGPKYVEAMHAPI